MKLLNFLKRLVTWWDGQTVGTQIFTWRHGEEVGKDAQGNRFFQSQNGARRWVIYNGEIEASRISAQWHGWLHHTWSDPPGQEPLTSHAWQKEHMMNPTGTAQAHIPAGSIRRPIPQPVTDYEAWSPQDQ